MFVETSDRYDKATISLVRNLNLNGFLWKKETEAKCYAYHNWSLKICKDDKNSWNFNILEMYLF